MMIDATTSLAIQWIATLYMCGVIVFVQLVHYPLFAQVDETNFQKYSFEHQRRTNWVVALPMLVEFAMAILLFAIDRSLAFSPLLLVADLLLIGIWLSTAMLQIPIHSKLLEGKSMPSIIRLVRTNWIRTIAWPARAILVGIVLKSL